MEGTAESRAVPKLRLRGRARAELGLQARGGSKERRVGGGGG